jgi:predicted dehydrogenase
VTPAERSVAAPTRVGIAGINERARRLLLPGLLAAPRARLKAVCSRDPEKARAAAEELSATSGATVRAFTSVRELVTSGEIDALYVNTPLETHVAMCREAIRAGCAVICEKPLAPTAAESEALVHEAARAGVRTAVNFTYRSVPAFRMTERWLGETGGIGRPLHARFELLQGHDFLPGFPRSSALLDSGCHLFDLMAALLHLAGGGAVTHVRGEPLRPDEPDYGWTFAARTEAALVVSALFSRSALGWRNGLRWTLSGDARAIEAETDGPHVVIRAAGRGDGEPQGTWRTLQVAADIAADDARFAAYHLDRLVGAVCGEEALPDFRAALFTNRVAEALAASARTGAWSAV